MATTSHEIPLVGPGDEVNPISTPLNAMANALNDALDGVIADVDEKQGYFIGTNAERTALTAPKLRNGITWFATDTGIRWDRIAGAWVQRAPFATARGTQAIGAGAATITFPANKFTLPPVITGLTVESTPLLALARPVPGSITKDQFQVQAFSVPGAALVPGTIHWQAEQATPTSAAG